MEEDLSPQLARVRPDRASIAEAERLGIPHWWEVAADYTVQDRVLVEAVEVAQRYAPATTPHVVTELAKLREGDEAQARAFAKRWGALGYVRLLKRTPGLSAHRRNELLSQARGDPLPWVWAHARGVHTCLDLLGYLQDADIDGLERYLQTLRDERGHYPALTYGWRFELRSHTRVGDSDAAAAARGLVAHVVTTNLEGLSMALEPTSEGTFRVIQTFDALCDLVYWHLANSVASLARDRPGRLARCEECGAFFLRTDPRQRFCPAEGPHSAGESRCAKRARARRLRSHIEGS